MFCVGPLWATSLTSCPLVAGVVPRHELIYEKLLYKMDASDDVSLLVVGRCSFYSHGKIRGEQGAAACGAVPYRPGQVPLPF